MKNSILFLLLVVLTITLSLFLPWWIIAPLSIAATYFSKSKPLSSFFLPFSAIFLAWLLSIYFNNSGTISELMGKLFEIDGFIIPFIASALGGLVAGFFGLAGSLFSSPKKNWVNG
ncbi:MAG: hypothetical protein COA58_12655 [Bacteroidetes bacterium]|nr:MAG: hypothetical protein COA58_12655 [Bacteroidota bacterium]